MKKKHEHIIQSVRPGSIAEELGIEPGDILLEIDGQVIEDIFDYQFYVESEELLVVIRKANGEEWELEIEKDVDEDLGIDFGKGLMDEYHSCHNKCYIDEYERERYEPYRPLPFGTDQYFIPDNESGASL